MNALARNILFIIIVLIVSTCSATAVATPTWPNCDFSSCTAEDVQDITARVIVPGGCCQQGSSVSAKIEFTVYVNSAATRPQLYAIYDLYINDNFIGKESVCMGTLSGKTTYVITPPDSQF